jgi:hypothetical protein
MITIKFAVADPWDFDAGNGSCEIIATVNKENSGVISHAGEKKQYWFVAVSVAPIIFKGMCISSLLLTPRHVVALPPLEIIESGGRVLCNAVWRKDCAFWDSASVQDAQKGCVEVDGLFSGCVVAG